ncbi:MAG: heme ABC transporter permease CcmC [Gammaproteobacteria bacterium]
MSRSVLPTIFGLDIWLHRLGSPKWFYRLTSPWLLPFAVVALLLHCLAVGWGLFLAPSDFRQGEAYRIIYLHVPAASLAQLVYGLLAVSGLVFWIWRIRLAAMLIAAAAPVGTALTLAALFTGALWGQITWGTWWLWSDPRLMSSLVLLFLYLGLVTLNLAFDDKDKADRLVSVLAVVGAANLPVIRYSVEWWNSLHQPASLSITGSSLHASILWPLLAALFTLALVVASGLALRMNEQIQQRYPGRVG